MGSLERGLCAAAFVEQLYLDSTNPGFSCRTRRCHLDVGSHHRGNYLTHQHPWKTCPSPWSGAGAFFVPFAAGGLLLAFNLVLGWLYLGQTLTS